MIFHADRAAEKLGLDPKKIPHFEDRLSGRNDDRPDFDRLRQELIAGTFDLLIVYRIDRITRRLVTNAELAELFQKTKTLVYTVVGDRTFDMTRRSDWEDFVNQGVRAEGESRELESRVRLGLEFRAVQGKFLGAIPTGYKRVEGLLVPNTDLFPGSPQGFDYWTTANRAVEILVKAEAVRPAAREVYEVLGWKIHASSLRRWALSAAVQGHSICKYAENLYTHPAVVSLDQAETIAQKDFERSQQWGHFGKKRFTHLFVGLAFCANCGSRFGSKPAGKNKAKDYIYYRCVARLEKNIQSSCTGKKTVYGRNTISEEAIEQAVREKLKQFAKELAALSSETQIKKEFFDPQIAKLEKQIKSLDKHILEFGDLNGFLTQQRQSIEAEIRVRQKHAESPEIDHLARQELAEFMKDETSLDELSRLGRKQVYKRFVSRILIDWDQVAAIELRIF